MYKHPLKMNIEYKFFEKLVIIASTPAVENPFYKIFYFIILF